MLEPQLIDAEVFDTDKSDPMVLTQVLCLSTVLLSPNQYLLGHLDLDSQRPIRVRNILNNSAEQYVKVLSDVLLPEIVSVLADKAQGDTPTRRETLTKVAVAVEKVRMFFAEFPYSTEYIREMVLDSDANFGKNGRVMTSRLKGESSISSYAWYAKQKGDLEKREWQKWVGLPEILPDDRAAQPVSSDRNQTPLRIVRLVFSGR